jgi:hypothetical protein
MKIASFQLIELHSIPASQGRIVGYRIGEDQSGGNGTILQPVAVGESGRCLKWVQLRSHGSAMARPVYLHLVSAGTTVECLERTFT